MKLNKNIRIDNYIMLIADLKRQISDMEGDLAFYEMGLREHLAKTKDNKFESQDCFASITFYTQDRIMPDAVKLFLTPKQLLACTKTTSCSKLNVEVKDDE